MLILVILILLISFEICKHALCQSQQKTRRKKKYPEIQTVLNNPKERNEKRNIISM